MHLSLEPPILYLPDDEVDNLFALRPRLLDITQESVRVYTRSVPPLSVRQLVEILMEYGSVDRTQRRACRSVCSGSGKNAEISRSSRRTASSIRPSTRRRMQRRKWRISRSRRRGCKSYRGRYWVLSSASFFPSSLLKLIPRWNDSEARTQLITALDLLSILSPATDPPAPDLPLPAGSIIITPAQPDPAPSTDPAINPLARLPLATSLDYIKTSANAFFTASKSISREEDSGPVASTSSAPAPPTPVSTGPTPSDLWSTILHFHSSTSYKLLPLGAVRGASLNTAKGEERAAHQIGIFFGCEEGGEAFRRAAVSTFEDLVQVEGKRFSGRKMVIFLQLEGSEEEVVLWDEAEEDLMEEDEKGKGKLREIENLLRKRGRSAFAEEIFSIVSEEARLNPALKARLISGNRSVGESISMVGNGWSLRITMVRSFIPSCSCLLTDCEQLVAPKIQSTTSPKLALLILSLLRILLLSIFAQRRASLTTGVTSRPLLGTISTFLNHILRARNLRSVLESLRSGLENRGLESTVEERTAGVEGGEKMAAMRIVRGDKDLGGMIVFRVGKLYVVSPRSLMRR